MNDKPSQTKSSAGCLYPSLLLARIAPRGYDGRDVSNFRLEEFQPQDESAVLSDGDHSEEMEKGDSCTSEH